MTYWSLAIKELEERGINARQIAEALQVSIRTVSGWRKGSIPCGLLAVRLHQFHKEKVAK